jgi:hypothetical protein
MELTYSKPLFYGEYRIYHYDLVFNKYAYVHNDYDGAPDAKDHRHGTAKTIEDCIIEIDEIENQN